jgi:hypothetical protein
MRVFGVLGVSGLTYQQMGIFLLTLVVIGYSMRCWLLRRQQTAVQRRALIEHETQNEEELALLRRWRQMNPRRTEIRRTSVSSDNIPASGDDLDEIQSPPLTSQPEQRSSTSFGQRNVHRPQ